jgi:predicted negative regulator of RcsB-dependent stress response
MLVLGQPWPWNAAILIAGLFVLDAALFAYQLWREHQQAQRKEGGQ